MLSLTEIKVRHIIDPYPLGVVRRRIMKQKFDVTGMTCSACSAHVDKSVRKLDGVAEVNVNLLQNTMTVEYDESEVNDDQIIRAVIDGGYGAFVHDKQEEAGRNRDIGVDDEITGMKRRLWVSILFMIPLMYISMGHMVNLPLPFFLSGTHNAVSFGLTQMLLVLPVMYINRKFYQVGFKTLFKGSPNMDSLIAIGSGAAFVYGVFAIYRMGYGLGVQNLQLVHQYHMDLYFESASMILTLITVGKYLEARSKGKTSEAISKLLDLAPKTATVERGGEEIEIPVEELNEGDTVIVRPGASIPVDGVILEGMTSVDESALTGESIPVEKSSGDKVISASINKGGFIKFRATKVGDDTTLAQIIQLVEDASGSKAPIAKLADKIAGIFVPVVIVIALASGIIWLLSGQTFEFALSTAIAVLVISCPCALGLATPTAIMVGTGKGAENGILIKSAESLETAHEIKTVVLDKTGTVTEGRPQVTDIVTSGGIEEKELVKLAASMEKPSEHPLADAIVFYGEEINAGFCEVSGFESVPGEGIEGSIEGDRVYAGNLKMMERIGVSLGDLEEKSTVFASQGKTPLFFAKEGRLLGLISVADVVKPTSRQAIQEFEKMDIEVVMLTGDNKKTAAAIQKQLGIRRVIAEVLPQDKEAKIREIQEEGKKVAMIGDGINDAPALARADVGIAIGAGTDIAIESADIVLMKSDLLDGVAAVQLSKAVIKNIKENLFWAFFYNVIGIPLAAGCLYPFFGLKLNPMFGAAAMSLSSVFVVSNALRLKFFRPDFIRNKETPVRVNEPVQREEETNMKKTISIEGMMCKHCVKHVTDALNKLDGVAAEVSLSNKSAVVNLEKEVSDESLKQAVEDAGYQVTGIQ